MPDKAIDLLDDACARAALPSLDGRRLPGNAPTPTIPEVRPATVAEALAERTGIPLAHLTAADGPGAADPLICLRDAVVGQEEAVTAVAEAVRLALTL